MAEECLKQANDLSGLLLLYSSLGDVEGISELASRAKENGKNNVAFLCLFMLGKLEECLQILIDRLLLQFKVFPFFWYLSHRMMFLTKVFCSNRIPEAALMARSYLPSRVSDIVAIWRKDLNKVSNIVFEFRPCYIFLELCKELVKTSLTSVIPWDTHLYI